MKNFTFKESVFIVGLVSIILTFVLWMGMRQAREMKRQELMESCGVSGLEDSKIYKCPGLEVR